MLQGEKVSLVEVLDARENRVSMQNIFLNKFSSPLLSFTMNIPGEVKNNPLISFAFDSAIEILHNSNLVINEEVIVRKKTGCEGLFSINASPTELKEFVLRLETETPVGRLYDMDVVTHNGKLNRSEPRKCLLCNEDAFTCARSRRHSLQNLSDRVEKHLLDHACSKISSMAHDALVMEVEVTPKPGLVDKNNSGAHTDMDIHSFYASAAALQAFFAEAVRTGYLSSDIAHGALMDNLRKSGLKAEREMYCATGGVNTHKGMVYSMGILLGSTGRFLSTGEDIFQCAANLAGSDILKSLKHAEKQPESHGDIVYCRTGAKGARGEAASGFPTAKLCAFWLDEFISSGLSLNDAAACSLAKLMAQVEDSNVLYRAGINGLTYVQQAAKDICSLPPAKQIAALFELDKQFISRNISPGGSADILAMALLLNKIKTINK